MQTRPVTRQQVIELAEKMPIDKLAIWYEYGLFVQSHPLIVPANEIENEDSELAEEIAEWEAASDADWLHFEEKLAEMP